MVSNRAKHHRWRKYRPDSTITCYEKQEDSTAKRKNVQFTQFRKMVHFTQLPLVLSRNCCEILKTFGKKQEDWYEIGSLKCSTHYFHYRHSERFMYVQFTSYDQAVISLSALRIKLTILKNLRNI